MPLPVRDQARRSPATQCFHASHNGATGDDLLCEHGFPLSFSESRLTVSGEGEPMPLSPA
jgi:hypothetical protein